VRVARTLDGFHERRSAIYVSTSHDGAAATITVTPWTMKNGMFVNQTCLLCGKRTNDLEHRSRWILCLYGPYKHRFMRIIQQFHIVVAAFPSYHHIGVVARAAHKGQYLPGRRFDGDHTANLILHQFFGKNLKFLV